MSLNLSFSAGQRVTASQLNTFVSSFNSSLDISARKTSDESVNNGGTGTTLQNDNELFVSVLANTNYKVVLTLLFQEAAGTGIDLKCAWTFPTGCTLNLAVAGPHINWNNTAAALEAEWSAWQNVTSSPSGTISFGTTNAAVLGGQISGTLAVGSTGGTLQFQWAQQNSSASNVTVKAGSALIVTPFV